MLAIAIITGGYSGEAHISRQSAQVVVDHIDRTRFTPTLVHVDLEGWWAAGPDGARIGSIDRADFSVNGARFDGAFIMVHGTPGEDGLLQAYFDLVGLPHTTAAPDSMGLTFHKGWTTAVLRARGIPVARSIEVLEPGALDPATTARVASELGYPCFVKPNQAGSSIGISRVEAPSDLLEAVLAAFAAEPSTVLIESELRGREFSVGVVPGEDGAPQALPVTEIETPNAFFDYAAKYEGQSTETTPAAIADPDTAALQAQAIAVYEALSCRGMTRVDIIWDVGSGASGGGAASPHIIEVNAVPGFTRASIVPQQAAAAGISKSTLISRIIDSTILT